MTPANACLLRAGRSQGGGDAARAAELIAEAWRSFDHFRPGQPPIGERMRALTALGCPRTPRPALGVIDDAALALDESLAQPRPRFFAFVGSSALEIAVIGDALASCFDPNLAAWAAAATEIERQAVDWVAAFVGYPARPARSRAAARSRTSPRSRPRASARSRRARDGIGGRRLAVYCSSEAHYSVDAGGGARSASARPACARCRSTPSAGSTRPTSPPRSTPTARRASSPSPSSRPPARR